MPEKKEPTPIKPPVYLSLSLSIAGLAVIIYVIYVIFICGCVCV